MLFWYYANFGVIHFAVYLSVSCPFYRFESNRRRVEQSELNTRLLVNSWAINVNTKKKIDCSISNFRNSRSQTLRVHTACLNSISHNCVNYVFYKLFQYMFMLLVLSPMSFSTCNVNYVVIKFLIHWLLST